MSASPRPSDLLAAESLIAECRAFLPEWRATVRAANAARFVAEQPNHDAARELVLYRSMYRQAFAAACDTINQLRAENDQLRAECFKNRDERRRRLLALVRYRHGRRA